MVFEDERLDRIHAYLASDVEVARYMLSAIVLYSGSALASLRHCTISRAACLLFIYADASMIEYSMSATSRDDDAC